MDLPISEIDPSLEVVSRLEPSSVLVYKVKKSEDHYVFKTLGINWRWGVTHLEKEQKILRLAEDVPGITHLIRSYNEHGKFKNPFLKEFYEGEGLDKLGIKIDDTTLQESIEYTVRKLHALGIAGLDLDKPSNIVLSRDRKSACLIDLGLGSFVPGTDYSSQMDKLKKQDFDCLEQYIFG